MNTIENLSLRTNCIAMSKTELVQLLRAKFKYIEPQLSLLEMSTLDNSTRLQCSSVIELVHTLSVLSTISSILLDRISPNIVVLNDLPSTVEDLDRVEEHRLEEY